jgi:hypothetical protein
MSVWLLIACSAASYIAGRVRLHRQPAGAHRYHHQAGVHRLPRRPGPRVAMWIACLTMVLGAPFAVLAVFPAAGLPGSVSVDRIRPPAAPAPVVPNEPAGPEGPVTQANTGTLTPPPSSGPLPPPLPDPAFGHAPDPVTVTTPKPMASPLPAAPPAATTAQPTHKHPKPSPTCQHRHPTWRNAGYSNRPNR